MIESTEYVVVYMYMYSLIKLKLLNHNIQYHPCI